MQAPCAPNSDRSRCRSAGPDDQEALPCRDQTRKRIALVHPLAAPSWTAPANHLSIRRNHGSPMVSTRVLQHIHPRKRTLEHICPVVAFEPVAAIAAIRRTGVTEYRRSLRLDVGRPDHLAPLLGVVGDELTEIGGRADKRCASEVSQPRPDFGIGEAGVNCFIELVNNLRRRVLGSTVCYKCAVFEERHNLAL